MVCAIAVPACSSSPDAGELSESEWDALTADDTVPSTVEDTDSADDDGASDDDEVDDSDDASEPDEPLDDVESDDAPSEEEADVQTEAITHAKSFKNAVVGNCADPGVIVAGDAYYAVCTGGGFPIWKSNDLVHWTSQGRVFDKNTKPKWVSKNWWAPEIHHIGDHYVLYFAAYSPAHKQMCIGAARSVGKTIASGFADIGHPLVCDDSVGLIDPHVRTVNDEPYLYYKTEGNALRPQKKTIIYGRKVGADGLHPEAKHRLLKNTLAWEGDVVEAPWLTKHGSYYYMFYSGYRFCNGSYGVGVARARSPLGPFKKKSSRILRSNSSWSGPGHNSIVTVSGQDWIVYHAWKGTHECSQGGDRRMLIDRVGWKGGWPYVNNGTPSRGTHSAP